jgi:activator of 2-hydroxyglutaryl-CoA dehydratase
LKLYKYFMCPKKGTLWLAVILATELALGLHRSVVRRAVSMLKRVSVGNDIVFAGGVAKNPCIRRLLEEALEQQVIVPGDPQMVGAYGAALLAGENK